jgi:hypothetical protein
MVSLLMVIVSRNASVCGCVALFVAAVLCNDYQWPFIGSSENGIVTANNDHGLLSSRNINNAIGIDNLMSGALQGWS